MGFLRRWGSEEAFRVEGIGVREVVGVVADGVLAHGHVETGWDPLCVYDGAAGADFAPEGAGRGGRETHGFFEAGAEVVAGVEEGTLPDVLDCSERASDLGAEASAGGVVAGEIEEGGGEGGGCGVAAWWCGCVR